MSITRSLLVLGSGLAIAAACSSSGSGDDLSGDDDDGSGASSGNVGGGNGTGASGSGYGGGVAGTGSYPGYYTGGYGGGYGGYSASGGISNTGGGFIIVDTMPDTSPIGMDDGGACASQAELSGLTPVNMVVLFDMSGSMGDDPNGAWANMAYRWIPVSQGMISFFTESGSLGLAASLKFFPVVGDVPTACTVANYEAPDVPLTPLSQPAPFVNKLETTTPVGGTPTYPALQGTMNYAQQLAATTPGEQTVIVLVTDGEPGFRSASGGVEPGCTDNDIAHVAAVAQAGFEASPSIRTYVIGIGVSLENLNAVALAGGTEAAMMVSVTNPEVTRSSIQTALESIRTEHISCNVRLPRPPTGQALDVGKVNVYFVHGDSTVELFDYSEDCSTVSGRGWHFDDRTTPTKIMLCQSTCDAVQADQEGHLQTELGCITRTLG